MDRSRDALLTDFGRATLDDCYLMPGEEYQDLFARIASYYGDDATHVQRIARGRRAGGQPHRGVVDTQSATLRLHARVRVEMRRRLQPTFPNLGWRSVMRMVLLSSALVCAAIAASTPGQASVVNLGVQSAPASVPFGNSQLSGAFLDSFEFSIDLENTFLVSSFLTTGFTNRAFINDMQASLFSDTALIEAGTAISLFNTFPKRDVSLAPVLLTAGNYRIDVVGTATSVFPGPTSSYGGSLTVAAATQVTEPGTALLLTGGLVVLAAVSFRSVVRIGSMQEQVR